MAKEKAEIVGEKAQEGLSTAAGAVIGTYEIAKDKIGETAKQGYDIAKEKVSGAAEVVEEKAI